MTKKITDLQAPLTQAHEGCEGSAELRRRAEEVLERRREGGEWVDPEKQDLERMVHDLEVQQVELQMQQEDLRQARDRAEEQGWRFRKLFNLAPTAYLILAPSGRIKRANRAAADLLTCPPGQLAGRSFLRYMDLDDTAQVAAVFKQVLANHKRRQVEARLYTPQGDEPVHVLFTLDRGDPLLNEETEVFASLTEITDLVVSRDALDHQRREYRALVDNLPEVVVRLDRDGRVLYINPTVEMVSGIPAAEFLGHCVGEVDPSPGRDMLLKTLEQVFAGGKELEVCLTWPFPDRERHFKIILVPEHVSGDGVATVLAIAMDMTDEAELYRSLEQARERAEQGSRTKSAFLANMSHEIRTPISGILGMCGVLLKKEEEPSKALKLQMMRDAAQSLLSILNDILDLSRMEVGRFELHERVFSPRDMISKLQALFEPRAVQKGLELVARVGPRVPDQLVGDPDRISQVLRNLVDNAVKFTLRGSVTVTVRSDKGAAGTWALTFVVADTGPGVPKEWRHRIFENFTQIDTDYTRKHGGAGLGLSISKNLVDLMGGQLDVASSKGKGSSFSFTLPLQPPTREPLPEAEEARPMARLRILLAEDNPITQLALQEGLSDAGHRVRSAYSGQQVLEALEEETFDVVLMDVQMPMMDGLEATRRIRSSGKPYADLPIIGFTAYAHQDEQQEFLKAGMTACLAKPIEEEDLLEALGEVIPPSREATEGRAGRMNPASQKATPGQGKKSGKRKT